MGDMQLYSGSDMCCPSAFQPLWQEWSYDIWTVRHGIYRFRVISMATISALYVRTMNYSRMSMTDSYKAVIRDMKIYYPLNEWKKSDYVIEHFEWYEKIFIFQYRISIFCLQVSIKIDTDVDFLFSHQKEFKYCKIGVFIL